jgi:hypothetical protein
MNRRDLYTAGRINAGIWLIGLGVLWLTNTWWPGILILIGVSLLVQSIIPRQARRVVATADAPASTSAIQPTEEPVERETEEVPEKEEEPETPADVEDATPSFMKEEIPSKAEVPAANRNSWLPETCPACGGPVASNADKVTWPGETMAKCPFCGVYLKVKP